MRPGGAAEMPRGCPPHQDPAVQAEHPLAPYPEEVTGLEAVPHIPEVPLGVPQWNFSLTVSLRSQISAFLTWGCADNTPPRTAGKRGLCCGDGKRFFSSSPLDHGLENKTSQSVGSFNIGMISFIFGSFTQNANRSSRSLHNTKGFFQPFSHVFYTHT